MQSLVICLKRTALLAFLAVLGYGVGTVLQPADTSAEEVHCNHEYCTALQSTNPDIPTVHVCMAWEDPNIGNECRNFDIGDGTPHTCGIIACPIVV